MRMATMMMGRLADRRTHKALRLRRASCDAMRLFLMLFAQVMSLSFIATSIGQDASDADTATLNLSIRTSGVYRYQPGRWGVLSVRGVNATATKTDAMMSVFLGKDTLNQSARRFWIPSDAVRTTWLPIRIPESLPTEQETLQVSALHLGNTADGATIERRSGESMIMNSIFSLDAATDLRVGLILRRTRPGDPNETQMLDADAYEMLGATRNLSGNEQAPAMVLNDQFLPPYAEAYEGLDQLLICGDQLLADSGALPAIRSWLARGGRMWVLLDRTSVDVLDAILGNGAACEIVDRVELNDFELNTPGLTLSKQQPRERWVSEEPVEFVRVLVDSAEVHSYIDDWPAAFTWKVGNGELLVTTLAPRGWQHESSEFTTPPDGVPATGPTRALTSLAMQFHMARGHGVLETNRDDITPIIEEQIGYEIPSRGLASSILGVNFCALFALAVWLTRRDKLEHMAWAVPSATITTTLLLILVGRSHTSQVAPTAAIVQLVDIASETNEAHSTTLVSFFSSNSAELPLLSSPSSLIQPDVANLGGVAKRIVWDDNQRMQWENINVSSGSVRSVLSKSDVVLPQPVRAIGTFGPAGLAGTLHGADVMGRASDAVISSPPSANLAIKFTSDSQFVCGESDVMTSSQFIRGGLLTDQQQRRQSVYRSLLDPTDKTVYPTRTTLFAWGEPKQTGVSIPDDFAAIGSALYAIPLDIRATSKGDSFLVPSSFLRMQSAGGKWGTSSTYDGRKGKWRDNATASTDAMFRFRLPAQVLPCRVTTATLRLRIHAPSRHVGLTALSAGEKVSLRQFDSPSGVIEFVVDQPERLQVDKNGDIIFGVSVSQTAQQIKLLQAATTNKVKDRTTKDTNNDALEPTRDADKESVDATSFEPWQIDYFRIHVSGETT